MRDRSTTFLPAAAFGVQIKGLATNGQEPAGAPLTVRANPLGGFPPYTYAWGLDGYPAPLGSAANLTFTPESVGLHWVNVSVTDASGSSGSARANFSVYDTQAPSSLTISVAQRGNEVVFTAHVTGGVPPFSFAWTGPGAPAGWTSAPNWTTADLPSGRSTISLEVRDRYNATLNASVQVVNGATPPTPWYDTLVFPLLGIVIGLAIVLPVAYLFGRRRSRG